jgi:hypothetical protein
VKVVSGHQPVYLPWLGLIHKASLADVFVYMDDVQYLTGDWNNRNQIKTAQGGKTWLTVPVDLKRSPSDLLKDILVHQEGGKDWQEAHWRSLKLTYGKAPFFKDYSPFFEWFYLQNRWEKLSDLNLALLKQVLEWFGIKTELVIASTQSFTGKKSDLVLEHCERFSADVVVTGIFGKDYIQVEDFAAKGVKVVFQEYRHPEYAQRFGAFVSHLSFVDLLFQHGPDSRAICLGGNLTREDLA